MQQVRKYITVAAGLAIASVLVYGAVAIISAVIAIPDTMRESHAKGCLIDITQLADKAVEDSIPAGRYTSAIESADYMHSYYPVGAVLPEEHPFAEYYGKERRKQINRITSALKTATGLDHGNDWEAWKNAVANTPQTPPTAQPAPNLN